MSCRAETIERALVSFPRANAWSSNARALCLEMRPPRMHCMSGSEEEEEEEERGGWETSWEVATVKRVRGCTCRQAHVVMRFKVAPGRDFFVIVFVVVPAVRSRQNTWAEQHTVVIMLVLHKECPFTVSGYHSQPGSTSGSIDKWMIVL